MRNCAKRGARPGSPGPGRTTRSPGLPGGLQRVVPPAATPFVVAAKGTEGFRCTPAWTECPGALHTVRMSEDFKPGTRPLLRLAGLDAVRSYVSRADEVHVIWT